MKQVCRIALVMGMMASWGLEGETFGFGGLGRGSYQDFGNLALADRMGAFTPPADPFADRRQPHIASGAGNYGQVPTAPYPNQPVTPKVSAVDLMNPATGGLANLGRTLSSGQRKAPYVPPTVFQQPHSYALPSDMGFHSVSPTALPR